MSVITTPYQYQKDGVRTIHQRFDGRAIIGDEMGLGKSFQALLYAYKYLPEDPPGPIVITCPATIKINWKREVAKHLGMRAEVLYGEKVPVDTPRPHDPNGQLYVINYDILRQRRRKDGPAPDRSRDWSAWLNRVQPRLIIGDEIQYIKNGRAARSKAFRLLTRGVPRILALSGTPLTNSPLDLWPILNVLFPDLFPSRFEFAVRYTNARKRFWGWEFKGAKNLDELHAILRETCMIRRLKVDVLDQLPAKTVTVVPIEVDLTEYYKAEADFIGWLEQKAPTLALRAAKAEQITRLNFLKGFAGRLKVDPVISWVDDFFESSEGKLLLGAIHRKVTYPIVDAFGRRATLVDGDLSDKQKQACFDRFNLDPTCWLMVGNLQAAGVGWSCTATSDVAVIELPWTPGELEQFIARIHGLERGIPGVAANINILVAAGTIEEDLCEIIQTKQGWLDQVLDGRPRADSLDVYDQLKEKIVLRNKRKRGTKA